MMAGGGAELRVGKVLCGRSQVFGLAVASLVAAPLPLLLTYVTALPTYRLLWVSPYCSHVIYIHVIFDQN